MGLISKVAPRATPRNHQCPSLPQVLGQPNQSLILSTSTCIRRTLQCPPQLSVSLSLSPTLSLRVWASIVHPFALRRSKPLKCHSPAKSSLWGAELGPAQLQMPFLLVKAVDSGLANKHFRTAPPLSHVQMKKWWTCAYTAEESKTVREREREGEGRKWGGERGRERREREGGGGGREIERECL
jgi:hypothetical protein